LSQADCVIDKLHESLSEADIQAAASGHLPDSVSKAAFNAGAQCGGE
jgi:hypothetical protein